MYHNLSNWYINRRKHTDYIERNLHLYAFPVNVVVTYTAATTLL